MTVFSTRICLVSASVLWQQNLYYFTFLPFYPFELLCNAQLHYIRSRMENPLDPALLINADKPMFKSYMLQTVPVA